jgi:hypothetical protein
MSNFICPACLRDPDPRGWSACFDCRELRRTLHDQLTRLAKQHGFMVTFANETVAVLRFGVDPFVGSPHEALAYLTGWARSQR